MEQPERKGVNYEALRLAESLIKKNLRTLSDIPHELANTVANIYYSLSYLAIRKESAGPLHVALELGWVSKEDDIDVTMETFVSKCVTLESSVRALPEFIKGLRDIDKTEQSRLYQYSVDYIIDCLKYDIPDVNFKSPLRRKIERKFRQVDEIPNLVDLMSFD